MAGPIPSPEGSGEPLGDRTEAADTMDTVAPNRWELFLAGESCCGCGSLKFCPPCACLTFFGLGWLFTMIFLAKLIREGTNLISFESAHVQSNLLVQQAYAFEAARGEERSCADDAHNENQEACEADQACEWDATSRSGGGKKRCGTKQLCPASPPRTRERSLVYDGGPAWVSVIYEAENAGNLLDDDSLEYIRKFEAELLTTVKGVQRSGGVASAWNEDWCRLSYPIGPRDEATGRCAAPITLTNLFSMTAEGRQKTRALVEDGFSFSDPLLGCICTDTDETLCSICNGDGTLKGWNATSGGSVDWTALPPAVTDCFFARGSATTTAEAAPPTASSIVVAKAENAACGQQGQGASSSMSAMAAFLTGLCATKPSCQWAPPQVSVTCSSTAFYHPTDLTQGLVKGAEKEAALNKMCDEENVGWWTMRRTILPRSFDCTKKESSFGLIAFHAGGDGSADEGDTFKKKYVLGREGWYAKEQLLEREVERESGGKVRMMLFSAVTLRSQYLDILMVDIILSVFSLVFVWGYMWWSLESAFLASVAMFEIVFSLPVAMCIWSVILGQKIFFYQLLTVYMILGIGADDAFILYDAWRQACRFVPGVANDRAARFAWAYRRSAKAMATTTATTCGSFVIGVAASPLPQVQAFCVFAGIVVFVDWIFCITLFASAVALSEKVVKTFGRKPGECCGPGFCCGLLRCIGQLWCKPLCGALPDADDPPVKRPLENFCEGPLYRCLVKMRWILIVFWILVLGGMAGAAAGMLRTAEKPSPLGRQGLDAMRGLQIVLEEFSVFGSSTTSFVYGLDAATPVAAWSETNAAEQVKYSATEAAKVASPKGQMELLNLCRAADLGMDDSKKTRCDDRTCLVLGKGSPNRCASQAYAWNARGVYMPDDVRCENGRYCFMETFAEYWAHYIAGAGCRAFNTSATCSGNCTWDDSNSVCHTKKMPSDYMGLPAAEFMTHLGSEQFAKYQNMRYDTFSAMGREHEVLFDKKLTGYRLTKDKSALEFAWVSFNATYPSQNTVEQANTWFDRWEAFRVDHSSDLGGFQTTDLYKFMVTQNEMVKAAVSGVCLSLVISLLVLLLVTWNWRVAVLGLLNIIGITVVFLGLVPLVGWSLGEYECIFLIAVVGLSVDYSVHLLHAYHHGHGIDRASRTRHALAEMGISVVNSSITTLLAASFLFACGFYFFLQFGAFIFMVTGLSILMSLTFLMPILLVAGPEGDAGFLPKCFSPKAKNGALRAPRNRSTPEPTT